MPAPHTTSRRSSATGHDPVGVPVGIPVRGLVLLGVLTTLSAPALGAVSVLPAAEAAPSGGAPGTPVIPVIREVGGAGAAPTPTGVWPLQPRPTLVRGFDPPGCTWCAGHRGVDLAGVVVEPVRAVLPGTVRFAGTLAGRGVVVVDHGSVRTTYQPVAASVRRGEAVAGGAEIGRLEAIGSHCFPVACLHLGLIRDADDAYLDPLTILPVAPQPVRLLPV